MPQQQRFLVLRGTQTPFEQFTDYLLTLAPYLIFDGTLTDDKTKIKNRGSGGATFDGTPTAITIDANGMNFNGTTSKLNVPNGAGYANQSITTQVIWFNRVNGGAGNNGVYWIFASNNNRLLNASATTLASRRITSATNPQSVSTTSFANGVPGILFMEYDDTGDRLIHLYKGLNSAVSEFSYSTNIAATGTLTSESNSLNIGNDASNALGFNGSMRSWSWINGALTALQKLNLTKFAAV